MPRDTDKDALIAFKKAFGDVVPVRGNDAKIRLGKVMIALDAAKKALAWARSVDFDPQTLLKYAQLYKKLSDEVDGLSNQPNPDMDRLEKIKKASRVLADTIHRTRQKTKLKDLPPDSGIYVNDIPGLDDMDPQARQAKITEVRQQVCRGNTLTSAILQSNGEFDGVVPTKETVVDMCWYFKGMAQEKLGDAYQQGALTLPDPDGKLAKFIDGCPDIYPRDSSHLRPEQRTQDAQGRGIDFGGAFPGGMNTVLLHPFVAKNGERRLYVKFESAGAYGHLRSGKREVARRPEVPEDKAQSEAHAKAFVSGGGKGDLAETREGTVDLNVLRAYQAVFDAAGNYKHFLEPGKQRSKMNSKGKVTGFSRAKSFTPLAPDYWDVQTQTDNMLKLHDELKKNPQDLAGLKDSIGEWVEALDTAGYKVDARIRLGDEVVLEPNDLKQVRSQSPHDGDVDTGRALIQMLDLFESRKAQQARLLEGTKKDIPYVYYRQLVFRPAQGPRKTFDHVLTLDTQVRQFEQYAAPRTKVEAGTVNKGTNVLKQKYFEYTGNVGQDEMFAALQATGWNMANLKKSTDLKRK